MSYLNPFYPVREAAALISKCQSMVEIEHLKNMLIGDIDSYSLVDQGFLMTMVGLQIIKIEERTFADNKSYRTPIVASFRHISDN